MSGLQARWVLLQGRCKLMFHSMDCRGGCKQIDAQDVSSHMSFSAQFTVTNAARAFDCKPASEIRPLRNVARRLRFT